MAGSVLEIQHLDASVAPSPADWSRVLALGKQHSSTLGFLPDTAFDDRRRHGTLIVARLSGEIVGYCLYDLPRAGHIKLVHVCVGDAARGLGAGRAMIDAAVASHPSAIGVLAYCRDDYKGIDRFWSAAGMSPRGERPGRAEAGSTLIRWWRPLGGLDLIEEATLSSGLPIAVYDTNVVSDLFASDPASRPDHLASSGLLAPWLQASITAAVSPRVDIELNRIEDRKERAKQRSASVDLIRLRAAGNPSIYDRLTTLVGSTALAADRSLADDLLHVADAIEAGASFFITNDENLIRAAISFIDAFKTLRVVRPHQLVAEMLNRLELPTFQSSLIESVDLEWTPAANHPLDQLVIDFLAHERDERSTDLKRALRTAIATQPRTTRVLVTPEGRRWALLSEHRVDQELQVDLLRTIRGEASGTVASQLARHLRTIARDTGLSRVRILDQMITSSTEGALLADGFVGETDLTATLVNAVLTGEEFASVRPEVSASTAREIRAVERTFWPLIIVGADLPTFVIPVQPRFAERLFAWDRGALFGDRKRGLGLSREHVYYSGSGRSMPPAGSRILWYVTKDATGTVRQLHAFSRGLGCERAAPDKAFSRHSAIGVFKLRDVQRAASKRTGLVTVVRFEDTELLSNPLGDGELAEVFARFHVNHPIPSFREVDPRLFDAIIDRDRGGAT